MQLSATLPRPIHVFTLAALVFATVASAAAAPLFASYHQYTSAQHQSAFNTLSADGYRRLFRELIDFNLSSACRARRPRIRNVSGILQCARAGSLPWRCGGFPT